MILMMLNINKYSIPLLFIYSTFIMTIIFDLEKLYKFAIL